MRSFSQTVRDGMTVGQKRLLNMSLVSHDSAEKNIVSFISKITVCWHFTAAVFKSLASADE